MTLFVYPELDILTPRSIRVNNITKILKLEFGIDLKIAKYKLTNRDAKNSYFFSSSWKYKLIKKIKLSFFIRKLFPRLILPDFNNLFINENINNIFHFIENNEVKNIVIVVYPFSSYKMVKKVRLKFTDLNIILDIGDPLYKNSDKLRVEKEELNFELEKEAIENTTSMIVTNLMTKNFYVNTYEIEAKNIKIIPQGVDIKIVNSLKIKNKLEPDKKIKLIYSGIFYEGLRDPENLFNALCTNSNFTFDVYGSSMKKVIKNVFFYERVSQEKLFLKMFKMDILVFIDNAYGIQTSGKIYELLAFKKPILFLYSNENSETISNMNSFDNIFFIKNDLFSISNFFSKTTRKTLSKLEYNYDINELSWAKRANDYMKLLK